MGNFQFFNVISTYLYHFGVCKLIFISFGLTWTVWGFWRNLEIQDGGPIWHSRNNSIVQDFWIRTHSNVPLRSSHTRGPVPATSAGDQVPPCEQLIFGKNLVAGTEFWSPQLVPRIQTSLNSWD